MARHGWLAAALVATVTLGACGTGQAATSASTTGPEATPAGPTAFAVWTARQGFGGGSGLREIRNGAEWLQANPTASDRASWLEWWAILAADLGTWLDGHPATACWAAFHQAARDELARIADDFATMRLAVSKGGAIPPEAAGDMVDAAVALDALSPEPGCP